MRDGEGGGEGRGGGFPSQGVWGRGLEDCGCVCVSVFAPRASDEYCL